MVHQYTSKAIRILKNFALIVIGFAAAFALQSVRHTNQNKTRVDASWLRQARDCWRGLASSTDSSILEELSKAPVFRTTFPLYEDQTDFAIHEVAQHKTREDDLNIDFFAPDGTVRMVPVIETEQARNAVGKIAVMRRGSDAKTIWIPIDQLHEMSDQPERSDSSLVSISCVVRDGSPAGFKQ